MQINSAATLNACLVIVHDLVQHDSGRQPLDPDIALPRWDVSGLFETGNFSPHGTFVLHQVKGGLDMARKYSRGASKDVEKEMHEFKRGKARSGKAGKGGKVKSRKQAIAIGLSKARKKGKKVPRKAA
jgi:hypothetical protein